MKKTFETGHSKNVESLKTLISYVIAFGSKYNPSREVLQVANLQKLLSSSEDVVGKCMTTGTANGNDVKARYNLFKNLKPLGTQIVNALDASDVPANVVAGARTINRKLQGVRAPSSNKKEMPAMETPDVNAPKTISASQQSFDSKVKHFDSLVELVSTQPNYTPNEDYLHSKGLQQHLISLKAYNATVIDSESTFTNTRLERNEFMYAEKAGMVDIALDVKKYVLSVFQASSPQYKQINKISFKNLLNK